MVALQVQVPSPLLGPPLAVSQRGSAEALRVLRAVKPQPRSAGRADGSSFSGTLRPCLGATLAGLAASRKSSRGRVTMAARAVKTRKKKSKAGGNQKAVEAALAAMQKLEEEQKVSLDQASPAQAQAPATVKTKANGQANGKPGRRDSREPNGGPQAQAQAQQQVQQAQPKEPAKADGQEPPTGQKQVAREPQAEPEQREEPEQPEQPESVPPVDPTSEAKAQRESPARPSAAPKEESAKPTASAAQDAFAALADFGAIPSPSTTTSKPQAPSKVQQAFADLADFDVGPSRGGASRKAPEEGSLAEFQRPAGGQVSDDVLANFLAPQMPKPKPAEPAEPAAELEVDGQASARDEEEDDDKDKDEDEDEDEDDEPMVQRRRGEADQVDFKMETGGLTGRVSVGLKEVAIRLGGRQILQDASWVVRTGDRLALVGENGCGKTTQLRVLMGELEPDTGGVVKNQEVKMAILSQGFVDELDPERTLKEELLSAVPREARVLKELNEVQQEIEEVGVESEKGMELIDKLTSLQTEAEELRAYDLDGRMDDIIQKVNFLPEDLDQQIGLFSGGWKVRIGLSKIFMTAPDVLLLDEPTNHLDLNSVEWLEVFLQKQTQIPMVIVSHDREFMDRVCNRVVDTVEGMTYTYRGNYTEYIRQRDEKMVNWRRKYLLQEKQVAELQKFIKVNKGRQMMANARNNKIAELEKLKASDKYLDPPPKYAKRIKFTFPEPPKRRRGSRRIDTLCSIEGISHGYGKGADSMLFENASLAVGANSKIGIIGRNGVGKSTLLRLLMGIEKPSYEGGRVYPADPAQSCFFTQHQADLLPPDLTAYEVVKEGNQILMDDDELIEIMKKFRFKGDRLNVQVSSLSGGEKARLAIVRMMLTPTKLLVFDEPTNHLDVAMKETLEYSLREFEGAVVVVSHDRWFLSQTCEKIVDLKDKRVVEYDGDFRSYMDKNPDAKKQIESHYTKTSEGIGFLPLSRKERQKAERGGLRKYRMKRWVEERKEEVAQRYGRRRR